MHEKKTVLITGGAKGIGYAIAKRFREIGHNLILLDANEEQLRESSERLKKIDSIEKIVSLTVDVSDWKQVQQAFERIDQEFPYLDVLINNAGIFPRNNLLDISLEEWQQVIQINLTGYFIVAQQSAKRMIKQKDGCILQLASGQAFRPVAGGAHYAASKGGIVALTRALAVELAEFGIRVNTLVPGVTDTDQPLVVYTREQMLGLAKNIPLQRIGEPTDVAGLAEFLISDAARYITGQSYAVNGGSIMI